LTLIRRTVERLEKAGKVPGKQTKAMIDEAIDRLKVACLPSAPWSTLVRSEVEADLRLLAAQWTKLNAVASS
jgi:hypothetical protein